MVSFLSRSAQLESSFSYEKKTSVMKSWTYISGEAIKVYRGKVLKESFIIGRSCDSTELLIMHTTLITLMVMCL